MKHLRKVMTLVLAALCALAVATPAWADDPTGQITIKSNDTVDATKTTFNAYKILDATFTADGKNVAYTVPSALKSFYNSYFTTGEGADAKDVTAQAAAAGKTFDVVVSEKIAGLTKAADMQDFVTAALAAAKTAGITPTASVKNVISGLTSGYYIVEDQATKAPISSLMLDTVNDANVDIVIKANVPTPDKKIVVGNGTADANNAGVGTTVNYVVTENVPNYAGYDHYYFILDDTLSTGLTFNNDVKVYIDINGDGDFEDDGEELAKGTDFFVYTGNDADGKTFQVAFNNIKAYPVDADIQVTYSAQVNSDAVTGKNPNTNKVEIEYSNNPSKSERPETENKPGKPNSKTDHPLGTGPADWTATYTTEIDITKIDGTTKAALEGVEFTLTGTSTVTTVKNQEVFSVDAKGTYYLLKDGTYTTDAPKTESTMERAEDGATSGYVVAEDGYEGDDAIPIGEVVYREYKDTDAGAAVYVLNQANDSDYVSTVVKYAKTIATAQEEKTVNVKMIGTTDSQGKLVFKQLGEGTYTISETGVPEGYNQIADITVAIDCTEPTSVKDGTETATWSKGTTGNVNADGVTATEDGKFTVTLENNKGTELPSTGGMGTTILYTVGGILIAAGGIWLVTKKRLSAME